jgi:hypothetical protein
MAAGDPPWRDFPWSPAKIRSRRQRVLRFREVDLLELLVRGLLNCSQSSVSSIGFVDQTARRARRLAIAGLMKPCSALNLRLHPATLRVDLLHTSHPSVRPSNPSGPGASRSRVRVPGVQLSVAQLKPCARRRPPSKAFAMIVNEDPPCRKAGRPEQMRPMM